MKGNHLNHRIFWGCKLLWAIMVMFPGEEVTAQQFHRFFYGTVMDEETRRPLAGANLQIPGSRIGTTTNPQGEFSFFTDTIPAPLIVSHLGYQSKTILLDETSYQLALYLNREMIMLPELEITAKATEPFFRSDTYSVYDYDVDSTMVWVLIYRQRLARSELICRNIYGDTVARSAPLTFTPVRLFRDCIGTLHVLGKDSGYQVFLQGKYISLIHPVKMKKFDDILKNCIAATAETMFFRRETDHGLSVEFFGVNRLTLDRQILSVVEDREKMKMKRRNPFDSGMLNTSKPPSSREDFVTWNYVHKILYRPVKASLQLIGQYTCIFNAPDRQVEFYDAHGNFSYKLSLRVDQGRDGRWTEEIMIDKTDHRVYTTFFRNGRYALYEIDLNTGNFRFKTEPDHFYPEKIRVHNGWIYYLFDVDARADNKILFRRKI